MRNDNTPATIDQPAPTGTGVPSYYVGADGTPAWDVIENYDLGYNRGCALKYLVRAGKKTADPREDLRKAIHCLHREIEVFERTLHDVEGRR